MTPTSRSRLAALARLVALRARLAEVDRQIALLRRGRHTCRARGGSTKWT